jgi:putative ABC transport system substrate-binding protein
VFARVNDPVAQGFVSGVRQPGGNLTGFSFTEFSVCGKWLSLLKEAAPGLARAAVMFNPDTAPYSKFFIQAIEAAATSLGVQVIATPIRAAAYIEPALASFTLSRRASGPWWRDLLRLRTRTRLGGHREAGRALLATGAPR